MKKYEVTYTSGASGYGKKMNYVIRDHQAGNEIDRFSNLDAALEEMQKHVDFDKEEGIYVEEFYEVYDEGINKVIAVSE